MSDEQLPPPSLAPLPAPAQSASAARPPAPHGLRRRIVDFLPLLLAALLALGTTWLVKSMPKIDAAAPQPPSTEPDYYLRDFVLRRFTPAGVLQAEMQGVHGDHVPNNDQLRVQQARSYSADAQGNQTRATASRAVSDGKGQNIELIDNVRVVHQRAPTEKQAAPEPIVFESNYVKATDRQEHISTNQPVKVTRGANVITGSGMEFTNSTKVVQVQGRVNAVIAPQPAKP